MDNQLGLTIEFDKRLNRYLVEYHGDWILFDTTAEAEQFIHEMNVADGVRIETEHDENTYIVDLLIGTDIHDETVGSSERWVFNTRAEQMAKRDELVAEYPHALAEQIHVNECGEFDERCVCGNSDFFTVIRDQQGTWRETDPIIKWDGWGCVSCNRVFNDNGAVIAKPNKIVWGDA